MRGLVVASALSALYFVVLFVTADRVGFVRDEGYYFKAAEQYVGFFDTLLSKRFVEAFSDQEIQRHLGYNTEHPPLAKFTFGITHRVLHDWLGVTSNAQGFRVGGFLFAVLSFFATFLLGKEMGGERVGLVAAVALATLPRYFFDAHLACFDVAITALWTLALVTFHRALVAREHVLRRSVIAGVVFGLALATKLNALFLPAVWALAWLFSRPRELGIGLERTVDGGMDLRMPRIPLVFIACMTIGPAIFFAVWPHLWHDTFARVGAYLGFHLHHEHYPASWFHELLVAPPFPWSFPIVMSALTLPGPVLALGLIGFVIALGKAVRERSGADALLVVSVFIPIFLIALPSTPIFGGVKHWYNAMPPLMVLAARTLLDGLSWAASIFRRKSARVVLSAAAMLLFYAPGVLGSAFSHPNGIGYYNELAGGFRGGAELGLQRGFWGGLARPLLEGLAHIDRSSNTRVFFNRTNYDSYVMYRRDGIIANDISYANDAAGAEIGVVFEQPEHAEQEAAIWGMLGTRPYLGVYQDNVTLAQIYRRGVSDRAPDESLALSLGEATVPAKRW